MDGGAMRQPARKLAPRQQVTQVEDPEFGTLLELPAIDIEGDPDANVLPFSEEEGVVPMEGHNPNRRRRPVTEIDPIDIQGSRSADVEPFNMEDFPKFSNEPAFVPGAQAPARRADGVSTMLPEWVPPWATQAIGQPVRTGMGGSIEWEFAPLIAELVADEEGRMPDSMVGIGTSLMSDPVNALAMFMNPATAPLINQRAFSGAAPTREARSLSPEAAALGFADAGAVPLNAAARLMGEDNFVGMFDDGTGVEGADWEREIRTSQRQNPGSFAVGELANMAAQMPIPSAAAGRGASTAARVGYAALEGAAYGGAEGMARSNAPTFMGQLQDSAIGAVGGGLLGGGLAGASARLQRAADDPQGDIEGLRTRADLQWASQAGAAGSAKRQREMAGGTSAVERVENMRQMVSRLRELGALEPRGLLRPATEDSIAAVVTRENEAAQRVIFETLNRMDESGTPDIGGLLSTIDEQIARLDRIPSAESATAALRAQRNAFARQAQRPDFSFQDLQAWKNRWRLSTNFTSDSPLQADRQAVYGAIRDNMQDNVASVDPELAARYRGARATRRMGMHFDEMRADDMLNEARNRNESLTDIIAGTAAGPALGALAHAANAGTGGSALLGAAGLYAGYRANKFIRENSHGWRAMSLERAANALESNPARFGAWAQRLQAAQARGPQAFAAALYIAQQNDAAVREAVATEEDMQQMRDAGTAEQRTREEIQDYFSDTPQMTHPVAPSTEEERAAFFR